MGGYFSKLCWLAMLHHFVSDEVYFKLHPIFNWKLVKFF